MAIEPVIAPDKILLSFEQLKSALIDTSSIIYSQKAGFFNIISRTIQLYSIPEVIAETEIQVPGIALLPPSASPSLSTDQKLISCALENKLAMISEDKSILRAMRRARAPYYNALMMLNFLLFSKKIDDDSYRCYYSTLEHIARYSQPVWEFGQYIYSAMKKEKRSMDIAGEVISAEKVIRPYIRETYLEYSPFYSRMTSAEVYFKLENLQHTGSFKLRGAMNKLLSLTAEEKGRGVVTASTGNHGAAFAFGLSIIKGSGVVFVPENASPTKVEVIERLGAEVRHIGSDSGETEAHARHYAEKSKMTHLPPYNDVKVIGGQGTIALELTNQLDQIDAVYVALGGGGMISGIAGYLKSKNPEVEIIGCSPENSQVMIQSVKAGRILDLPSLPTLSDGTAGGVEPGSITLEFCREFVDDFITVTESEIKDSLREFIQAQHMLIEGSAAVAVAACKKQGDRFAGKNVVVVICGGNISLDILKEIL